MSYSRRRTPIKGVTTAKSEKFEKRQAHKRLRAGAKRAIARDAPVPRMRDVSNIRLWGKDGRLTYFGYDRRAPAIRRALAK
jgi:hypothetical protein